MSSFTKQIWAVPLWILPKFSAIPLLGSQLRRIPLLFSSKLSDPPTKILPPPPPRAINNDWSLKCKYFSLQCLRPTKSQISSSSSNKKIGRRGAQIQKTYQKSMRFNHGISRRMESLTINKNSQYGRYGYFMELQNKVQKLLLKFL